MASVVATYVWHYWLGAALAIGAVLAVIAVIVGYIVNVVRPRYPRRS